MYDVESKSAILSQKWKIYISISKITENVGLNFRIKVQNFGKKWHHMVLLLTKNSKAGCLFRIQPNFLKQAVIEI